MSNRLSWTYIRSNPAEFVDFNIAWSVNISFAYSFTNSFVVNKYVTQTSFFAYFKWRF